VTKTSEIEENEPKFQQRGSQRILSNYTQKRRFSSKFWAQLKSLEQFQSLMIFLSFMSERFEILQLSMGM
jgi:hypothetical protein